MGDSWGWWWFHLRRRRALIGQRASILFCSRWREASEDGGDHLVMFLESIVIAPRWSAASGSIVGVVVQLFVLELLGQAEVVFYIMFGILVKGA